uniref:Ig-like domain-containing protein n=1 Tax=Amphilophus citrinellus TaxID=61819 RepID=A0A3Q0RC67_AMPCI
HCLLIKLLELTFKHLSFYSLTTHSLMHFITASVGLPNFSEFLGVLAVDGVNVVYCDSSSKTFETRQDWMETAFKNNTQLETYKNFCFKNQPVIFRSMIRSLRELFNQSGAHFLQRTGGCEWDENTGEVTGVIQYGYDGEGFIEFDSKTLTWTTLKPEAVILQQAWNKEALITATAAIVTAICPQRLKLYVSTGKSFLQRKVLPSVSLLQKSPSSPISCHATGFYPHRAMMFWRKDGEEVHEGVDHGEILPNNDETSQMSVDLNVSSVTPEDWSRYECVFQLSGVEDSIVTKLNKRVIRTNGMKNQTEPLSNKETNSDNLQGDTGRARRSISAGKVQGTKN